LLKKRQDVTFVAIGDDTDSEESKKMIGDEWLPHFRLLGRKSGIESFVNIMDVCVLSTFTEGISNSILEYMALSKPVVATDGGGTKEIVMEGETGFLVNPGNADELAARIESLLNNDILRHNMGRAGRERVRNHFSIDKMIDSYVFHYSKLVAK
jgi:glycosyltransferase involved in cell wall biosynthesis